MYEVLLSEDLFPGIVDETPYWAWNKIAIVCKFWYEVVSKKKEKIRKTLTYHNEDTQRDMKVRVDGKWYYLPAYNQFNMIKLISEETPLKGKKITAEFSFLQYNCRINIYIDEMELLQTLFDDFSSFSNKIVINCGNLLKIKHIEKYISLQKLLKKDAYFKLHVLHDNKYETFIPTKHSVVNPFDDSDESPEFAKFLLSIICFTESQTQETFL
jgi:hypothetical protein